MSAPLVSIIVPAFDAASYLPATLRCVLRQTYRPLEAVLWDDGSTDATPRVLARWAARLEARGIRCTLGAHPGRANRGVAATRNAALAAARGELIQFIDADDLMPAHKVAAHVAALRAAPQADLVHCKAYVFRRLPRAPWLAPQWRVGCPDLLADVCFGFVIGPPHVALVRRNLFERVGCFDEALWLRSDREFTFRAAAAGARFLFHDARGALRTYYRRRPGSLSAGAVAAIRGWLAVQRRIATAARERAWKGWRLAGTAYGFLEAAYRLARLGHADEAAASAAECLPLLADLERHPPLDWSREYERPWLLLAKEVFRAPGVPDDVRARFARWAVECSGASRFRTLRARAALRALAEVARRPSSAWARAVLSHALYFRSLGIPRALASGGPLRLALDAAAALPGDAADLTEWARFRLC